MVTHDDKTSLLVFRVGPVLCCAPSLPISSIIVPPKLNHPPGSNLAKPGIFKHGGHIVSGLDLRYKFGVEQADWVNPGRMIITTLSKGHVGFWVDEILEVIEQPKSGWGKLPPLLPRGVFSRTLLLDNEIYLYAEFDALNNIPTSGYLRVYIQHLLDKQQQLTQQPANSDVVTRIQPAKNEAATVSSLKKQTRVPDITTPPDQRNTNTVPTQQQPAPRKPKPIAPVKWSAPAIPQRATATTPPKKTGNDANASVHRATLPPLVHKTITPAVNQPAVNISKPTVTKMSPRTTVTQSNSAAWLFIIVSLLLITGTGWLVWSVNQPDKASINTVIVTSTSSTKPEQTAITSENSSPPPIVQASTAMTTAITPSNSDTITIAADSAEDSTPTTTTLSEHAPVTTPQTDTAQYFQATIEKDNEGLTIVIDAPEETDIFKPDQIAARDTTHERTHRDGVTSDINTTVSPVQPVVHSNVADTSIKPVSKTEVIHIVVRGDTLWHIAIRYLNNPYLYPELARLSNIKNPDLIYPGNRVRIIKRSKKPADNTTP